MTRDNIVGTLHGDDHIQGALSVGGGTTNYEELENKPSINGVELVGNMSIWQPKDYSTDEQNTGVKWINGKPIYQKVVVFNNIPKNGDIYFDVTNGENYMLITGKLSNTIPFPYIHGSVPSNNIGGFFDGDKWSLRSGSDAPNTVSGFIIIQYTKTTD